MRILINDYAGHPFSLDLAIELSKKNKIIYTYFKNDIGAKGSFKNTKNLKIFPIEIKAYKKKNFFSRFFYDFLYGIKFYQKVRNLKFDFVLVNNTPINSLLIIFFYCKLKNKKFYFWIQDIYYLAIQSILKKNILNYMICKYFFLLENYILKKSNHVITISEQFKKILVKDKINVKKISVINNWAPHKIKSIKTIKLKKKLIKIIYTGTLAFKHDPDLIFEIIKSFSDIAEFDFFCSGTGAEILRLKQRQNKLKNLNLFTLISDKNYSKVLSTADFCLATLDVKTKNEFAVPSKVYSYIAALKPIIFIGPKNNSQFKIINKYNLGLAIKSKNIKLIKKIFIKFYKKKQNLIKINNNLKKYKKKNFDIKKISKKFTHILK